MWFTEQGQRHSMQISPNPECLGWVPGTKDSLFLTSVGNNDYRCQLIDWGVGNRLWNIPIPKRRPLAVGLTRSFVLFCVAEPHSVAQQAGNDTHPGIEEEWLRTFYAINLQDGSLVALWQAQFPHRSLEAGREYFLQLADELFYVTPDEVTKLNLEDIRSKGHGWR
jgi:hypothetical protein